MVEQSAVTRRLRRRDRPQNDAHRDAAVRARRIAHVRREAGGVREHERAGGESRLGPAGTAAAATASQNSGATNTECTSP